MAQTQRTTYLGAACAMGAVCFFSVNDLLVKGMSGDYALHQIVLTRSVVGIAFLLLLVAPFAGGLAALRTQKLRMHVLRGLCVVCANLFFYLGLAAMPLAEAVAIFFVSPLVISVFSVIFLGESVGPRRWTAIVLGLIGVLLVLRPGSQAFQVASLLPLAAAVGYAMLHIMTRKFGGTESALAMSFYVQVVFVLSSGLIGLALGHGGFAGQGHPSVEFLMRGWVWLGGVDLALIAIIGVTTALGGVAISQAYKISEAAMVAPFEYLAMPLAVIFGIVFFDEWPDVFAWSGIALILGSGLVLIWREAAVARRLRSRPPELR